MRGPRLRLGDGTTTRTVPTQRWSGPRQPNSPAAAACRRLRRSQRSRKVLLPSGTETGTGSEKVRQPFPTIHRYGSRQNKKSWSTPAASYSSSLSNDFEISVGNGRCGVKRTRQPPVAAGRGRRVKGALQVFRASKIAGFSPCRTAIEINVET